MKHFYFTKLILIISTVFFFNSKELLSQTQMPLPVHSSVYGGIYARGYWFIAPCNFIIVGLKVAPEAGTGLQYIHVMKCTGTFPIAAAAPGSSLFTTLAYISGATNDVIQTVNISVQQGDQIGIMGTVTGINNSYSASATITATINGFSTYLNRFGYQGNIETGPALGYWGQADASAGQIGRVFMYYITSLPTNAGLPKLVSPSDSVCSGTRAVNVSLKNYGPNPMTSCKIDWKVNNVAQTQINWSGNLAVNDSVSVNLGSYNFIYGTIYNIMAASSFPNNVLDAFPANDTVIKNNIIVKQAPSATPTSTAASICAGDSVQIGGSFTGSPPWNMTISDGTYSYSYPGLTLPGFAQYVSPTVTTNYTVTSLTDATGCSAVGIPPVIVTVNPL
ncbi:MAG: hypothetical protein NTZ33_13595, partial [Bacteroidetes bacterium]|nr:hypothetical protein [Bacteroidota bacterium]